MVLISTSLSPSHRVTVCLSAAARLFCLDLVYFGATVYSDAIWRPGLKFQCKVLHYGMPLLNW